MSNDATRDLKKKMAVPPIPQPPPRDRSHGRRDRTRVRLEISREQCAVFLDMLGEKLRSLPVESKEFKSLYGVYWALKAQINRPIREVGNNG